MNDVERKSMEIRRTAFDVLEGKVDIVELQKQLHIIERHTPEQLDNVVKQLEEDNGRWSETAGLPHIYVQRDAQSRVQTVTFESTGKNAGSQKPKSIVWRSDHSEIIWVEDFAKDLAKNPEQENEKAE